MAGSQWDKRRKKKKRKQPMKKNKLKNNKWKEWIWFQVWNKNIQQKMFQEQKKYFDGLL